MDLQSAMWRCIGAQRSAINTWNVYNQTRADADFSAYNAATAECVAANLALQNLLGPPYFLASHY